jgi:ribonuclease HI
MVFYAVANGRNNGVFLNWDDCNNSIKGYKNALFKKFKTKDDADNFIQINKNFEKQIDQNNTNDKIQELQNIINQKNNEIELLKNIIKEKDIK